MGLFPRNLNEYVASMGIPRGPLSKAYLVDPVNGSDSNPGTNWKSPLLTLEAAEDLLVANRHDAVLFLAGSSGNNLAAALTWDKNYTHLLGLCAPTHAAQRSRIFQTASLTGASPLLNITATGCMFKNFYIFQGVDDATSLLNVQVTGGRNYFENIHFAGGGHASQAINGGASLKLNGAEENMFRNCTIGVDTINAATGMVGLLVDGNAQRNVFEHCKWTMHAGNAGAAFVEIADNTAFDRYMVFDRCQFLNSNQNQFEMTAAFAIPAQTANRPCRMYLIDCVSFGAAKWDANDRGVLFGNMDVVTPADTSGEMAEMVT